LRRQRAVQWAAKHRGVLRPAHHRGQATPLLRRALARGGDRVADPRRLDRLLRLPTHRATSGRGPHPVHRGDRGCGLRGGGRPAHLFRLRLSAPARGGGVTADLNPAMAWDRLLPPERGGGRARRAALHVEPLRRLEVDELLVRDDDLPDAEDATLFWLEGREGSWEAWAATIDGDRAVPWVVRAARLRLERSDPLLLAQLGREAPPDAGELRSLEPLPRTLACICRERSVEAIYRSVDEGW